MKRLGCSQLNASRVVKMWASTYLYKAVKKDESALKLRIKEVTQTRLRYGCRRAHILLRPRRPQGQRQTDLPPYREEGLSLRLKRPRRNEAAQLRQPKQLAGAINEIWSMNFVADALLDGRKLRMLTVVDLFTRECLAIDVGQSLKGEDVVRVLNEIFGQRGLPKTIKTDNAGVECFNGRLHQECPNASWFCHWPAHGPRSRIGGRTTTRVAPTLRSSGPPPPNSPPDAACRQHRRCQGCRKSLLPSGTENGSRVTA